MRGADTQDARYLEKASKSHDGDDDARFGSAIGFSFEHRATVERANEDLPVDNDVRLAIPQNTVPKRHDD